MIRTGPLGIGLKGVVALNRPDTDFGSGGHITQTWPKDPVDHAPLLRHGLKIVCWNMDWFADLFAEGAGGEAMLKPDDMVVRGPSPTNQPGAAPTVAHRMRLLTKAIVDLAPDVLIVLEGPSRAEELAHFFARIGHGEWVCHVQKTRTAQYPAGPVHAARRCIGIAVRTDTSRFASDPVVLFDAEDPDSGLVHDATEPFFADRRRDLSTEWFRFETRPLYAEIRPVAGAAFRILGVHLKSPAFFGGYDWSRWVVQAEANRARFAALSLRLRHRFLDAYLSEPETRDIPLLVTGGLNEGAGADVCDPRGHQSAAELLMGSVWAPHLTLGNALYDTCGRDYSEPDAFDQLWTMQFSDPISERIKHRGWVDHVLYSRNAPEGWCAGAQIPRATLGGLPFEAISDHFPVTVRVDTSMAHPRLD